MNTTEFKVYDLSHAPTDSRMPLEKINELNHGKIPNVYAVMAESSLLLKGRLALKELFEKSGFSIQERKIVLLTVSRMFESAYSTAVHSSFADKHDVPAEVIEAIRAGTPLVNKKWETLRWFTAKIVTNHGQVADSDAQKFVEVGYTRANILDIVLAIGMVTITNYTALITKVPLDEQFKPMLWKKAS